MEASELQTLRSFNRVITERLGTLNDHYLARGRPLGASRVLWEIGNGAGDVRTLRARLSLDSGYLSRLLRSLEAEGLVTVEPSSQDSRVRTVALTDPGRQERRLLDDLSDTLAATLLAPLDARQRSQLVDAAATAERLLTAGLIELDVEDPRSEDAQHCIGSYFAELDERFQAGFDPTESISAGVDELTEPEGLLVVARLRGQPIGCGALKFHGAAPTEIKRMWVDQTARGLGLGRRLLAALEDHARRNGAKAVRLETNRSLDEAISLYRSAGYNEVPAFNDEAFAHHWFEKHLDVP